MFCVVPRPLRSAAVLLGMAILVRTAAAADVPLTSAFTYQGQLQSSGAPYTGTADLRFTLWPDSTAGPEIGNPSVASNVTITNGLFAAPVNANGEFGGSAFTGAQRWLKIAVRTPHDPTNTQPFTPLSPREAVTSAPYALGVALPYLGAGSTPATPLLVIQNAGFGQAISGESASGHGVVGKNGAGSGLSPLYGYGTGVWGDTDNGNGIAGTSGTGFGVYGAAAPITGLSPSSRIGVVGDSHDGIGVAGLSVGNFGTYGVHGTYSGINPPSSAGILGESHDQVGVLGLSNASYGVWGMSAGGNGVTGSSTSANGVAGNSTTASGVSGYSGSGPGVKGVLGGDSGISDPLGAAVVGASNSADGVNGSCSLDNGMGVRGDATGTQAAGVVGWATASSGNPRGVLGVCLNAPNGWAGLFLGNVQVSGTLSKLAGSFKIDDPIDPANKYLSHSFVESPDMMNIYNGNVTTDDKGYATVTMPDWFEALNQDFRYQLTVIDEANTEDFVQAKVVQGIADNRFTIRTSCPNATVSWQVTGIRHDAYAQAHRIPVEQEKPLAERGTYLSPAELGLPREQGLAWRMAGLQSEKETYAAARAAAPARPASPEGVATASLSR